MPRRLPAISLLFAWLCASGAMLDVAQVFAWTRMFADHARTESIAAAAEETFDPNKPCEICLAVSKARETASQHGAPANSDASDKIVLILERSACPVPASEKRSWSELPRSRGLIRPSDVPVPPPKAIVA